MGAAIAGNDAELSVLGSQISKRLPWPGELSTFMTPPCSRTISRTVAKPRPFPEARVVKNGSNIRANVAWSMPWPESVTTMHT